MLASMRKLYLVGAVLLLGAVFTRAGAKNEIGYARISGTSAESVISGSARFEEVKSGLKVVLKLSGVPDGTHALHIHEFGDCAEAGAAAGSHFNPDGAPHGNALKDGKQAHPGDLGNATSASGKLTMTAVLPGASLVSGMHAVAGRAIVLHEKKDDFGQPVGNAGGRIACGVITVVKK